jgi:hypothetical protein
MAYMCVFIPLEGVSLAMAGGGIDPEWEIQICLFHPNLT